ncbi:hypothetical protein LTR08_009030 [Meristemomyces frigidus]|nr:hypothetical protein LTR08_009030 [Meristemomyces frigidus]
MKSVVITAVAAWAAVAAAATNLTHLPHDHVKPWANGTHFTDRTTGHTMQHFVLWSNGTHFTDPSTNTTVKHFDCDVQQGHASAHFNRTVQRLHLDHQHSAAGSRAAKSLVERSKVSTPISVPLYIHVITKTASQGSITQAMANAQAKALNMAYNPYGITFVLKGTTFNANDAWAVAAGADMDALKKALRVGTYSTLNLYFHTDLSGGVLGTCTLPSQVQVGTPQALYFSDGCNINANTMPGASMTGYNMGKTAVHETGHWLGLLHTFEGYSCSGTGDFIADTTPESASTNGCPTNPWKSSCPGTNDPVHNYMDYSTDACYSRFTNGQVARMSTLWTQYRKGM